MTGIFHASTQAVFLAEKGRNQKTQIVAEIQDVWDFSGIFYLFFCCFLG